MHPRVLRAFRLRHKENLVSPVGFEPTTNGLKVPKDGRVSVSRLYSLITALGRPCAVNLTCCACCANMYGHARMRPIRGVREVIVK